MVDETILKSVSDRELSGHSEADSAESTNVTGETATVVRAKTRTVLMGGDFAQQIRERLGLGRADEEDDDGFVQVRGSQTANSPFRRAFQQSSQQFIPQTNLAQEDSLPEQDIPAPAPIINSTVRPVHDARSPIVGFLVSYDRHTSGEAYDLRLGRWIVSSSATMSDNFLVIGDESISKNHATIRVNSGSDIQIIDQFSEHGTGIVHTNGEEEHNISIGDLKHGDIVRFGKRSFHVSIVSRA